MVDEWDDDNVSALSSCQLMVGKLAQFFNWYLIPPSMTLTQIHSINSPSKIPSISHTRNDLAEGRRERESSTEKLQRDLLIFHFVNPSTFPQNLLYLCCTDTICAEL